MGRVLVRSGPVQGIVQIYQNYVANQQAEIANQQAEIANQHAEMKNVILFWQSLIIAICVIAATMKVT